MSLEDDIRRAAVSGGLTGLTLWPAPGGWQANARRVGSVGWAVRIHADPVRALELAIGLPCPADPQDEGVFG